MQFFSPVLGIGRCYKIWNTQGCERTFEGFPFKGSRSKGSNLVLCPLRRSGHGLSPVPSGERSAPLSPTSSKRTCKVERVRSFDFAVVSPLPLRGGPGRGF